jgi:hypothetical protein
LEREIDARIRRPASRGNYICPAGESLQLGIADGCADRIHVGIPMADDDRLHGAEESGGTTLREEKSKGVV